MLLFLLFDGVEGADLGAHGAAHALGAVNDGLAVFQGDSRAAHLQTAAAAAALVGVYMAHALAELVPLDQQARTAGDDGGLLPGVQGGHRLVHGGLHGLQVLGIHRQHRGKAQGREDLFHAEKCGGVPLEGIAGAGVVLVAGHAGDAVIQHAGDHAPLVVHDLRRAGHAAVEEGGIAHHAEHHLAGDALFFKALGDAHAGGEARAHAHHGVHAVQRGGAAQGIAADVAGDHIVLVLGQGIEESPVGAAGTEGRGPVGRGHVHGAVIRLLAQHPLAQQLGVQLVQKARQLLAHAGDAGGLDLVLHKGLQLLDDVELLHPGGKVPDQVHRQGEGQAQLQEGGPLREHLLGVFIGDGGGDDTHPAVAHLQLVQAVFQSPGAAVFPQLLQPLLHQRVVGIGVSRGADELADVAGIGRMDVLRALAKLHQALGVADPGGGAVQHRRVEQLGHLAGQGHKVLALLGIAGLHHGDLGSPGIVAVVLLILRGMAAGIVGGDHDERAAHAHVAGGEQGVRRYVQAHHFHLSATL